MSNKKNKHIQAITLPNGKRIEKGMFVQQINTGGIAKVLQFTSPSVVLVETLTVNGNTFISHAETEFLTEFVMPEDPIEKEKLEV